MMFLEKEPHQHTLPYTCFYDITPCTLEEMINYLNVYAAAMGDGLHTDTDTWRVEKLEAETMYMAWKSDTDKQNTFVWRKKISGGCRKRLLTHNRRRWVSIHHSIILWEYSHFPTAPLKIQKIIKIMLNSAEQVEIMRNKWYKRIGTIAVWFIR